MQGSSRSRSGRPSASSRQRAPGGVTALVFAGVTLAFAGGVPAGTALGTAIGWRWAFVGVAAMLLLLAVLAAALLPSSPPPAAGAPVPIREVLRRRPVLLVAVVSMVLTLGHYTAFTYVSPILQAAGVGEAHVSVVLFGYGAAGAAGLALAGALADRIPRGALVGAAGLVVLSLTTIGLAGGSTGVVVVATVVWGVAFGAQPTLLQTAARRTSADAGDFAPGLTNATTNFGIAGGGVLGGSELTVSDPSVLAVTGAGLAAMAVVLVLASGAREPVSRARRRAPRQA